MCVFCVRRLLGELCAVDLVCRKDYLDKHNHIPYCFNQDDVWPTLSKLFIVRETDLKQIGCLLKLRHLTLQMSHRTITLYTNSDKQRHINVQIYVEIKTYLRHNK